MRIAILTFHRAHNCGAMLQAWALKRVLELMGHLVEFPACNTIGYVPNFYLQGVPKSKKGLHWLRSVLGRALLDIRSLGCRQPSIMMYNNFRKHYLPERVVPPSEFGKYYDLVIVGSDQVWNDVLTGTAFDLFSGELIPSCVRCISYAASCGDNLPGERAMEKLSSSLKKFSAISVRENNLRAFLEKILGRHVVEVLDPTLLLPKTDYEQMLSTANQTKPLCAMPYIFAYVLTGTSYELTLIQTLSKELKLPAIIAPVYYNPSMHRGKGVINCLSPSIMLNYIKHADYVVASSFHGTALSILFKKKFLSLRNQVDQSESRPAALLTRLGEINRLVTPQTEIRKCIDVLTKDLEPNVSLKLESLARMSRDWLENAVLGVSK